MTQMKQQCHLWVVWFTWLGLPAISVAIGILRSWWAGAFVLIVGVVAQIAYVRAFPKISRAMGYGSVENEAAAPVEGKPVSKVILYTANVCPFCPIVRKRLTELQQEWGFELEEIDITFRPNLAKEKSFRSVPVVEHDGRFFIGNATSAELAAFLRGKP